MTAVPEAVPHSTVDRAASVPWEKVEYVATDGRRSLDVATVLPDGARVSPTGLAALFGNPARELDFAPLSVWQDVERERFVRPWRSPEARDLPDLGPIFDLAVERAMGDADVVGISLSGGLDSLLITYRAVAIAERDGRRVVAAVLDLEDDLGASSAAGSARLLDELGIRAELLVLPEEGRASRAPCWSPLGPREDALPDGNVRLAEALAQAGAQRVLNGSGADELLHVGSFIGPSMLAAGRRRALAAYLRDLKLYAGMLGYARELAALTAPKLPFERSFRLVLSLMFPGVHRPVPTGILAPRYEAATHDLLRKWIRQEERLFEAHDFSWPDYAAVHAICPQSIIPAATELPVYFPFQDPGFARAAEDVPLDLRYDETLPNAYHRMKSQVVRLFPPHLRPALPSRKQTFGRALSRAAHSEPTSEDLVFPLLSGGGLLAPGAERILAEHDDLLAIAAAVEAWLSGAVDNGYSWGSDGG